MTKHCSKCGHDSTEDALFCPRCGNKLIAVGDPLIGTIVADRYLLIEKLGEGRSGIIYRGEHSTLRKKVAVKILHQQLSSDEAAIERFRREATTVCEIDNDHILQVLDFGRCADKRLFFAMELLEGEPLAKLLERDGKLPIAKVVDIVTQTGEALMEAHALGYVHRDLRPRNLFLTKKRGREGFVKLLDFGLAKLVVTDVDAGSTVMGITFGDPRYISPEQARGDTIDRRSDIYSLGVIAYEMLTGTAPFVGDRASDIIDKHISGPIPSVQSKRPDCPTWLAEVVQRALAKLPDQRFLTVLRMNECLKAEKAPPPFERDIEQARTEPFAKPELTPPHGVEAVVPAPMVGSAGVHAVGGRTIGPSAGVTAADVARAATGQGASSVKAGKSDFRDESPTVVDPKKTVEAAPIAAAPTTRPDPGSKTIVDFSNSPAAATPSAAAPEPGASSNGTGPHPLVSDSSRKSKKQMKAEKRAEEQRRRTGKITPPKGHEQAKPSDSWWPADRKTPDSVSAVPPASTAAAQSTQPAQPFQPGQTENKSTLAMPAVEGQAPSVSAKSVADASAAQTSMPVATPMAVPTPADAVSDDATTLRNMSRPAATAADPRRDDEHPRPPNKTGQFEKVFFDTGRQTAMTGEEDEFEGPPKRNTALIAGISVAGVAVVALALVALLGRSSAPKDEGPKRSYDKPAVSAALEGRVKDEAPTPRVDPPKPPQDAPAKSEPKRVEPTATITPAVAVEEKKPAAEEKKPAVEEKKPAPAVAEEKKSDEKKSEPKKEDKKEDRKVAEDKHSSDKKPDSKADSKADSKRDDKHDDKKNDAVASKQKNKSSDGFQDPFSDKGSNAGQAESFIKLGRQKLNTGDYSGAAGQFNKAREYDKNSPDALAGLGECAFEQGEYNTATVLLKQAVRLSPRKTRYAVLLGQAYYKLGKTKDAVAEYKRALKLDPKNQEASQSLEVAERKLGGG